MLEKYIEPAMQKIVSQKEGIVSEVICTVLGRCWTRSDIINRCIWKRRADESFETLFVDGEPVLELHDLEFTPAVMEGDRYVRHVTQRYRKLGGAAGSAPASQE